MLGKTGGKMKALTVMAAMAAFIGFSGIDAAAQ
jgi:hypothetical protein